MIFKGNFLYTPALGELTVREGEYLVVEGEKLRPLLPELPRLDRQSLAHPVELLRDLEGTAGDLRLQLLPYRAVGVECGMLLALRLDGARVGTEDYGKLLLALSPTRLTDGGGYHALIGT